MPHIHRRHITHPAFTCVIKPSRSASRHGVTARHTGRASRRDTRPDIGGIRCPLVRFVLPTSVEDAVAHTNARLCRSAEPALGQNGFAEATRVKAKLTRPELSLELAGGRRPSNINRGRPVMSPQRQQMIEAMILAGLSPKTQAVYLRAVWQLAKYYSAGAGPAQRGRDPGLPAGPAPARGGTRHLRDRPRVSVS